MKALYEKLSTLLYFLSAMILIIMAISIMYWAVCAVIDAFHVFEAKKEFILVMLHSVGAVIISVATLDIAKYMLEEEVFRNKELREPEEARRTLTKVMTIIAIAVSVEGLVYIFKAGTNDMSLLIYPAVLILTAVAVIIGLGIYQKLSYHIEK